MLTDNQLNTPLYTYFLLHSIKQHVTHVYVLMYL